MSVSQGAVLMRVSQGAVLLQIAAQGGSTQYRLPHPPAREKERAGLLTIKK